MSIHTHLLSCPNFTQLNSFVEEVELNQSLCGTMKRGHFLGRSCTNELSDDGNMISRRCVHESTPPEFISQVQVFSAHRIDNNPDGTVPTEGSGVAQCTRNSIWFAMKTAGKLVVEQMDEDVDLIVMSCATAAFFDFDDTRLPLFASQTFAVEFEVRKDNSLEHVHSRSFPPPDCTHDGNITLFWLFQVVGEIHIPQRESPLAEGEEKVIKRKLVQGIMLTEDVGQAEFHLI